MLLARKPKRKKNERHQIITKSTNEEGRKPPRTSSFQVVDLPLKWINPCRRLEHFTINPYPPNNNQDREASRIDNNHPKIKNHLHNHMIQERHVN
jgi:hypothetical protein